MIRMYKGTEGFWLITPPPLSGLLALNLAEKMVQHDCLKVTSHSSVSNLIWPDLCCQKHLQESLQESSHDDDDLMNVTSQIQELVK